MAVDKDLNGCECHRPVGSYSFTPYPDGETEPLLREIERLKNRIAELEKKLQPVPKRRGWLSGWFATK